VSHPPISITFLGTGTSSGIPMIGCSCKVCTSTDTADNRLRTSIRIQSKTTTIIIDTTPDFRYQMLRSFTTHIDALLFTHPHKDHIAGLDDIRAFNYFQKQSISVYANQLTEQALRRDFYYAFANTQYPGLPELNLITIDEQPFTIGDLHIQPIEAWHHKMPVYGFRIGDFTYITDANRIDATQLEKISGSKILVLNALRKEPHISHFTLQEALTLIEIINPEQAYLTHISHQMGLHKEVSKELPPQTFLAYDGLVLEL
jgi:phosphoribosyl 1,2-cyclic phosphate phosphodiesterase